MPQIELRVKQKCHQTREIPPLHVIVDETCFKVWFILWLNYQPWPEFLNFNNLGERNLQVSQFSLFHLFIFIYQQTFCFTQHLTSSIYDTTLLKKSRLHQVLGQRLLQLFCKTVNLAFCLLRSNSKWHLCGRDCGSQRWAAPLRWAVLFASWDWKTK